MRLILIAILALSISSCSLWNTKPTEFSAVPVERIPLILPEADRIYQRNVEWIIITPETADAVFAKLRKTGLPVALIGVTGEGYEVLAMSNGDKMQFIKQLQSQIAAYKKYYIAVEERDTAHNKKAEAE